MSERLRRFILLALLLIVPLQGAAAVVHTLACAPNGEHAAGTPAHAHSGHDHGTAHGHPDEPTGTAGDHPSHQCCHHFSAAPISSAPSSTAERGATRSSIALPELSFVLERPQRPPRS